MLRFCSLASGSSGNATLVEASSGTTRTRVLIDAGLGLRELGRRLARIGVAVAELDALFITHEHSDHIGCAPELAARHGIPLWASLGTLRAAEGQLDPATARVARDGEAVAVGDLQLLPFTVPHDAREPLQLRCTDGEHNLGVLTDLGHVTPYVLSRLAGCDALVLECNHDPDLLAGSAYPLFLRRRIGGQHGHLNNAQAAQALAQLAHAALHTVLAAHLSERNNRPELAQAALAGALGCRPDDVRVATPLGAADWLDV